MKYLTFPMYLSIFLGIFFTLGAADSCSRSPEKAKEGQMQASQGKKTKARMTGKELRKIEPGQRFRLNAKEEMQRFWRDPDVVAALELSPTQVESFDAEANDFLKHLEESRRRMRLGYQKFLVALNQDPVDEHWVEAAAKTFRDAGADRHQLMTGQLHKFRSILSREQWMKLRELRPRAFQIDRFRPALGAGTARAFISDKDPVAPSPATTETNDTE